MVQITLEQARGFLDETRKNPTYLTIKRNFTKNYDVKVWQYSICAKEYKDGKAVAGKRYALITHRETTLSNGEYQDEFIMVVG